MEEGKLDSAVRRHGLAAGKHDSGAGTLPLWWSSRGAGRARVVAGAAHVVLNRSSVVTAVLFVVTDGGSSRKAGGTHEEAAGGARVESGGRGERMMLWELAKPPIRVSPTGV